MREELALVAALAGAVIATNPDACPAGCTCGADRGCPAWRSTSLGALAAVRAAPIPAIADSAFEASAIARAQRQADESRRRGDALRDNVAEVVAKGVMGDGPRLILMAALASYENPDAFAGLAASLDDEPSAPEVSAPPSLRATILAFLARPDITSSSCHGEAIQLLERVGREVWL